MWMDLRREACFWGRMTAIICLSVKTGCWYGVADGHLRLDLVPVWEE